jgi:hypothetical protein
MLLTNAAIRKNAADIMRSRLLKSAAPGSLFSTVIDQHCP